MIGVLDLVVYVGLGFLMGLSLNLLYIQFGSRMNWMSWASALVSVLSIALGLGWAYASILEREIQAAWVGLIIFGIVGAIFAALTGRLVSKAA